MKPIDSFVPMLALIAVILLAASAWGAAPAGSVPDGTAGLQVYARQVILALPLTMLREVDIRVPLPEVKWQVIRELAYGTDAKLMIGFNARP